MTDLIDFIKVKSLSLAEIDEVDIDTELPGYIRTEDISALLPLKEGCMIQVGNLFYLSKEDMHVIRIKINRHKQKR